MLENFFKFFGVEPVGLDEGNLAESFVDRLGGGSFGGGIMFAIRPSDLALWRENLRSAYPGSDDPPRPFAYDWLGDCLAEVEGRQGREVAIFEIGSGSALRTGASVERFLNSEIPDHHDQSLVSPFWEAWVSSGGIRPEYGQCVGYKVPLFLGGRDEIGNLELSDVDVYWTILAQLIARNAGGSTRRAT